MDRKSNEFVKIDPGHAAVLVASGTPTLIKVNTLDNRGRLIDSNNQTLVTIQSQDRSKGSIKKGEVHCEKGICLFDELVITLKPGLETTLILYADSKYIDPFSLKV